MEGNEGCRNRSKGDEEICQILALAREALVVCMAIRLTLRDQSLPVTQPVLPPAEFGFVGRQPFGFAYSAGREATFRVPCGHRFLIEHIDVSCWAKNERVEVQLVTRSRHMFRSLTVTDWPRRTWLGEEAELPPVAPILVQGSTANTFLFSNGEVHGSSTVPRDTCLEVWGYLEPT